MTASAPPWPGLADLPVRERLIVRFDAQTAGSGALTWGQRRVAALNAQLHPHEAPLNLRFAFPLAPGASAADVVAALGRAIESCEALRTRYPWHDPESTQTVCAQGELPCPVLEAPTLDTPYAFGLADELADAPFRDDDWPLRVAVVSGGVHGPRCLLFVVSHIAIDFFGIDFLLWHLRAVLPPGPGRAIDPGPSPAQPRDLAAWESGPEGQHEARRAIERHTRALTRMPQSMLPESPSNPSPRATDTSKCAPTPPPSASPTSAPSTKSAKPPSSPPYSQHSYPQQAESTAASFSCASPTACGATRPPLWRRSRRTFPSVWTSRGRMSRA